MPTGTTICQDACLGPLAWDFRAATYHTGTELAFPATGRQLKSNGTTNEASKLGNGVAVPREICRWKRKSLTAHSC